MANDVILSNIVDDKSLRNVQLETLNAIAKTVAKTQGPAGSSTMILHNDRFTEYSKDGHKVLKSIKFFKPLPQAIHDELINITEFVVKKVGDGTTEATIMSNIIFGLLCKLETEQPHMNSMQIIKNFKAAVELVSENIRSHKRECTLKDIEDICLISTNNNVKVTNEIVSIYREYGLNAYIDLGTSNSEESIVKTFDGIFIKKGYPSPAFINNDKATVEIRNPRIYYFADPVDTPEMMGLFENIFFNNIYRPYNEHALDEIVPTIILAPTISRDLQSTLADIEKIYYAYDQTGSKSSKPPFCIVSGINEKIDNIEDIIMLCGCPKIRKYINPDVQEKDIAEGKAPTPETVVNFYGTADLVEVGIDFTKFINPKFMFDESGEVDENGNRPFSDVYAGLIGHLEAELALAKKENSDITLVGNLKKRLNQLKSNFVQYLVGGVAASDRDNVRDLVEDAILNCRSAVVNGVGYGAGFEGYRAAAELSAPVNDDVGDSDVRLFIKIIEDAYMQYIDSLYSTVYTDSVRKSIIKMILDEGAPINMLTGNTTPAVSCSIETEPTILQAVSSIVSIMYTANQALLVDPMQNTYLKVDDK